MVATAGAVVRDLLVDGCSAGSFGGGIYLNGATPAMERVRLTNSRATLGGGMYLTGSAPQLKNVIVSGCTAAESGGGIWVGPGSTLAAPLDITNSHVATGGSGGGLTVTGGTVNVLPGSRISDCSASTGGLIEVSGADTILTVDESVLSNGNSPNSNGGCMNFKGSVSATFRKTTIDSCTASQEGGIFSSATDGMVHIYDNARMSSSPARFPTARKSECACSLA